MEHVWLLVLSFIGFVISWYIYRKINRNERLVCIIGEDCEKVVKSKYGKTFGFDNTILGMMYYGLVFVTSVVNFFVPALFELRFVVWGKLIISGTAALFAVYLTLIQLVVLKEWCEYCLTSAVVSIIIFIVVLV